MTYRIVYNKSRTCKPGKLVLQLDYPVPLCLLCLQCHVRLLLLPLLLVRNPLLLCACDLLYLLVIRSDHIVEFVQVIVRGLEERCELRCEVWLLHQDSAELSLDWG